MRITRLGEGVDATRTGCRPRPWRARCRSSRDYRAAHGPPRRGRGPAWWPPRRRATPPMPRSSSRPRSTSPASRPEILTGLEEGALSFAGATAHVARRARRARPGARGRHRRAGRPSSRPESSAPGGSRSPRRPRCRGGLARRRLRPGDRTVLRMHDPPRPEELAAGAACGGRAAGRRARRRSPGVGPGGPAHRAGRHGVDDRRARPRAGPTTTARPIHHVVLGRRHGGAVAGDPGGRGQRRSTGAPGDGRGARRRHRRWGPHPRRRSWPSSTGDACLVSEDDILDGLVASLL